MLNSSLPRKKKFKSVFLRIQVNIKRIKFAFQLIQVYMERIEFAFLRIRDWIERIKFVFKKKIKLASKEPFFVVFIAG